MKPSVPGPENVGARGGGAPHPQVGGDTGWGGGGGVASRPSSSGGIINI